MDGVYVIEAGEVKERMDAIVRDDHVTIRLTGHAFSVPNEFLRPLADLLLRRAAEVEGGTADG